MLPKLEHLLQIKVPQLQLAIPATEETPPIMAYNQDTYMEYHLILSNHTVDGIVQVGDALQMMVGGSIIEVHMKVIMIAHDKSCRIT